MIILLPGNWGHVGTCMFPEEPSTCSVKNSVADPLHFGVDPDPDPPILHITF
jgi:hypothetical protein